MDTWELAATRATVEVYVCNKLLISKYFNSKSKRSEWIKDMCNILTGVDELYFQVRHVYLRRTPESSNRKKLHQQMKNKLIKLTINDKTKKNMADRNEKVFN